MSDKIKVPLRFQVQVEERFHQPAHKRWRAQFSFYPLGWFRGDAHSPAAAVAIAWRKYRNLSRGSLISCARRSILAAFRRVGTLRTIQDDRGTVIADKEAIFSCTRILTQVPLRGVSVLRG